VTRKNLSDIAASVRQRLLNLAREQGEDFQLVLTRFALERFLHRLGRSEFHEQFILKGAMLFSLWGGMPHRATRDIDLLGFGESAVARLVQVFQAICLERVDGDGVAFPPESVRGMEIREDQEYDGVRITIEARLGVARILVQVDIGFGDAVTPVAQHAEYPTILDFPAPYLRVYPRESVVAEKFQAMIHLGMANSRMKDFYDLWIMGKMFPFEGEILTKAIKTTFDRRRTALPDKVPLTFTAEFSEDAGKQTQWRAFIRRSQLAPGDLSLPVVVAEIREFLLSPVSAAVKREKFDFHWPPAGPWRQAARSSDKR
jgi:predicted nucleotidyltransferase component of viral defense system